MKAWEMAYANAMDLSISIKNMVSIVIILPYFSVPNLDNEAREQAFVYGQMIYTFFGEQTINSFRAI